MKEKKSLGVDIRADEAAWRVFQDTFGPAFVALVARAGYRAKFSYSADEQTIRFDISPL